MSIIAKEIKFVMNKTISDSQNIHSYRLNNNLMEAVPIHIISQYEYGEAYGNTMHVQKLMA